MATSKDDILKAIEEMSVMDLVELISAIEEKFGVTPIPDAAYIVDYVYYKFPDDLSGSSDPMIIPDRFKHVLIDGAMMYMMRFRSNEQSAAMHQANFDMGIKSMRRILIDEPLRVRSTVVDRINSSNQVLGRVM